MGPLQGEGCVGPDGVDFQLNIFGTRGYGTISPSASSTLSSGVRTSECLTLGRLAGVCCVPERPDGVQGIRTTLRFPVVRSIAQVDRQEGSRDAVLGASGSSLKLAAICRESRGGEQVASAELSLR